MPTVTKSTRSIKEGEIARTWHLIDVGGKVLGRQIPQIVNLLQGKSKITNVPYLDMGDYVVVINAQEVKVTGKKQNQKEYKYFSGYPNGQRVVKYKEMLARNPVEIVRYAVSGMLPKNKLRDRRLTRLYIYKGSEHPYSQHFSQ